MSELWHRMYCISLQILFSLFEDILIGQSAHRNIAVLLHEQSLKIKIQPMNIAQSIFFVLTKSCALRLTCGDWADFMLGLDKKKICIFIFIFRFLENVEILVAKF